MRCPPTYVLSEANYSRELLRVRPAIPMARQGQMHFIPWIHSTFRKIHSDEKRFKGIEWPHSNAHTAHFTKTSQAENLCATTSNVYWAIERYRRLFPVLLLLFLFSSWLRLCVNGCVEDGWKTRCWINILKLLNLLIFAKGTVWWGLQLEKQKQPDVNSTAIYTVREPLM